MKHMFLKKFHTCKKFQNILGSNFILVENIKIIHMDFIMIVANLAYSVLIH